MARRPPHHGLLGLLALVLVLLSLLRPLDARAAPPDEAPSLADPATDPSARPVIVGGREGEILALFAPHQLGGEITPGWKLHSFDIDVGTITVWLAGPDDRYAALSLDHLDYGPPGAQRLQGFAAQIIEQPEGSEAALTELIAVIDRNDGGRFWGTNLVYAGEPRKHPYAPLGWDDDGSLSRLLSSLELWMRDGLVFYLLILFALIGLTIHELRGAPRWIKLALPLIVIVGALLRLLISPRVGLDPWPYTRVIVPAGRIYHGPMLALVHPEPAWMSETITTTTLAYAVLAPLAVFVHACELLEDKRAALLTAVLVAILPLHLRFSHSDTGFIASLTVASTVFSLLYVATRAPARWRGWLAVVVFALPILVLYQLRPLNILYFPMLLATPFVAQGLYADKPALQRWRLIACSVIVCVLTIGWGLPRLFVGFADNISEGLTMRTLVSAARVIFSPRFNALLNPVFTPLGLTALAIYGGIDLWRRKRRWLLGYIAAWYLGFLIAHAYIVPSSPYMQARYHLHLVLPYMLLVACGAVAASQWLRDNHERVAWLNGGRDRLVRAGVIAYALASPLLHLHAIRNVDFNDTREWLFVHESREQIPAECTILEYTGVRSGMRFARVGAAIERGVELHRWHNVEIQQPGGDGGKNEGEPEIPDDVRALLEDPPACLYWYEGLPCAGYKPVDDYKAPACHAIEGFVDLELVKATSFESRVYDENLSFGLGEREQIDLRLYRATRKP